MGGVKAKNKATLSVFQSVSQSVGPSVAINKGIHDIFDHFYAMNDDGAYINALKSLNDDVHRINS